MEREGVTKEYSERVRKVEVVNTKGEGEGDDERPEEPPASDSGTDSDSESGTMSGSGNRDLTFCNA